MPRRSHKKLKGRAKEEMLVTSRLMAISLLVDDYIYKNKPISLLEAQKFDEEITSLKLKCEKNTRSLQVVEKLKIFMKSIIKEQSIDRLQIDSSNFVTENCVDPLINVENKFTNSIRANTITELFNNRDTPNSEINNITYEINTQISVDVISTVVRVSNSEIKPVESNDIITPNTSSIILNDKSDENIKCTSKNIDFDKDDFLNNPTIEKEQAGQNLVIFTPSNLQKQPEQGKKFPIQENQKPNEIITGTKNKTKAIKNLDKNKITAKNRNKPKTKKDINHSNKELEKKSPEVNKSKKKPKEKTQINFSWVENIKYVREVSPDEHTDLQVEDSFWSNLTLPGAWNPNDFD